MKEVIAGAMLKAWSKVNYPFRKILRFVYLISEVGKCLEQLNYLVYNGPSCSAIDSFILSNYQYLRKGHFDKHYVEWRMSRIRKILQIYDIDFFIGKKVMEVGGGLGNIGAFFAEIGAKVLSLEGRRVNRNFANLRYRNLKNFKSVEGDLEQDFMHLGKFDLIINFGVLEVVKNVDNVMACCAELSDDILLETMVCDSTDPSKIVFVELDPTGIDNPMSGISARPSPAYIEKFFVDRGFSVYRYFDRDLNAGRHRYDWEHNNDNSVEDSMRRFWRFKRERQ